MPAFDFGDWPNVITAIPGYRILATMCYPKNSVRRMELHAAFVTERALRYATDPAAWSRSLDVDGLLSLMQARHQGRSFKEITRTTMLSNHQGHMAGNGLVLIRWMTAYGYHGSVLKACHIQAEIAKMAKAKGKPALTLGMTKITYTNAQALMSKAWSPYRDVAHLWAAYNLMINRSALVDGDTSLPSEVIRWFEDAEAFREFLAIAEDFRQFGEAYIPPPTDKPILNSRTTWRVPDHVQLSTLGPFDPPPLPEEILDALASYRA
jgi:hypothetical protein